MPLLRLDLVTEVTVVWGGHRLYRLETTRKLANPSHCYHNTLYQCYRESMNEDAVRRRPTASILTTHAGQLCALKGRL